MNNLNRYERETLARFPQLKELANLKNQDERDAFLLDLYESAFVRDYTNFVLDHILNDHTYFPLGSEGAFVVIGGRDQGLIIRSYRHSTAQHKNRGTLHSQGNDVSMILVSKDDISFTNYSYEYNAKLSVHENFKLLKLDEGHELHLKQGQIVRVQANRDVGDYSEIKGAATFLAITSRTECKYTFGFSKESRLPLQIIDATNHDTRIEYISQVFAALQFKDAVPEMIKLMASSSASGRWRLARDILSLDSDSGKKVILELSKFDEDQNVRAVALRSLQLLGMEGDHGA